MTTYTLESISKAKIRALTEGVRVYVLEEGVRYAVPSKADNGTCYEVHVYQDDRIDCNCQAGLHERACKHLAAVMMRRDAEIDLEGLRQDQAVEAWETSLTDDDYDPTCGGLFGGK